MSRCVEDQTLREGVGVGFGRVVKMRQKHLGLLDYPGPGRQRGSCGSVRRRRGRIGIANDVPASLAVFLAKGMMLKHSVSRIQG